MDAKLGAQENSLSKASCKDESMDLAASPELPANGKRHQEHPQSVQHDLRSSHLRRNGHGLL